MERKKEPKTIRPLTKEIPKYCLFFGYIAICDNIHDFYQTVSMRAYMVHHGLLLPYNSRALKWSKCEYYYQLSLVHYVKVATRNCEWRTCFWLVGIDFLCLFYMIIRLRNIENSGKIFGAIYEITIAMKFVKVHSNIKWLHKERKAVLKFYVFGLKNLYCILTILWEC